MAHHQGTSADSETSCPAALRGAGNKANCAQRMPSTTNKGQNHISARNVSQQEDGLQKRQEDGQKEECCLLKNGDEAECPKDDNRTAENCAQDILNRKSTPLCSDSAAVNDQLCKNTAADQDWKAKLLSCDQRTEVCCSQCNRRCHLGCLTPDHIEANSPWFCSQGCHDVSWHLAQLNCRGLMQVRTANGPNVEEGIGPCSVILFCLSLLDQSLRFKVVANTLKRTTALLMLHVI